jgi:hypothetical protein
MCLRRYVRSQFFATDMVETAKRQAKASTPFRLTIYRPFFHQLSAPCQGGTTAVCSLCLISGSVCNRGFGCFPSRLLLIPCPSRNVKRIPCVVAFVLVWRAIHFANVTSETGLKGNCANASAVRGA